MSNRTDLLFGIEVQVEELATPHLPENIVSQLETAAVDTLKQQQIAPPATLTLLLSDDMQLQQLNRDYRGFDKPTDVLSFENGEELPGMGLYLGDIAISVETAVRQAAEAGHPLLQELRLLTIHGVLHLLGHDHAEAEEKAQMWAAQDEILASQR